MNSPMSESATAEDSSCSDGMGRVSGGYNGGVEGYHGVAATAAAGESGSDLERTSTTVTNSSLNTTVVTRLEVSDRLVLNCLSTLIE